MTLTQAGNSDLLFFYDMIDVRTLAEADLISLLMQPPATMFYMRSYGCGVPLREGAPNSATIQIQLRSDIVVGIANRNRQVTAGANGYPDRRVFTSQGQIVIEQDPATGEVEIQVPYILSADLSAIRTIRVPGGK